MVSVATILVCLRVGALLVGNFKFATGLRVLSVEDNLVVVLLGWSSCVKILLRPVF